MQTISIRILGQENHRIRDGRSSLLPPGPLHLTHRQSIPKPTRAPRLDRTLPPLFPPPLHVSAFDGLLGVRGNGRSTGLFGVRVLNGHDFGDIWVIPSKILPRRIPVGER